MTNQRERAQRIPKQDGQRGFSSLHGMRLGKRRLSGNAQPREATAANDSDFFTFLDVGNDNPKLQNGNERHVS